LDPCVYDIFDSESTLELNPEVVTLTPGTPVYMCHTSNQKAHEKRKLIFFMCVNFKVVPGQALRFPGV